MDLRLPVFPQRTPANHVPSFASASVHIRAVTGPANDVRIDCKAAKHSDGDRGAVLAHLEAELREPRRRSSMDCSSAAIAARANKRRFVNLLQQLAGGGNYYSSSQTAAMYASSPRRRLDARQAHSA